MKIVAGQLLLFSSGSYSDYGVGPLMQANKDFDSDECVAAFNSVETRPGHESFETWLMREGFTEDIEYTELHTNSVYLGQKDGKPTYKFKIE